MYDYSSVLYRIGCGTNILYINKCESREEIFERWWEMVAQTWDSWDNNECNASNKCVDDGPFHVPYVRMNIKFISVAGSQSAAAESIIEKHRTRRAIY